MTPSSGLVDVGGGVLLDYQSHGAPGQLTVVFFHGYADSWRSFEPLLDHLNPPLPAVAVSLRGHGDSSRPPSGYDMETTLLDVGRFLDARGLSSVVLVGGSSGGIIARQLALAMPARVKGLVMLGTPMKLRGNAGVEALWRDTISQLTDPIDRSFVESFQQGTTARPVPAEFLAGMVSESLKLPARAWKDTLRALLDDTSDARLREIQCPTLLQWGVRDSIVPRSDQEEMKRAIAATELVEHPGGGHTFYWEDPGRAAEELTAFVGTLTA